MTDDRPAADQPRTFHTFLNISNGHNSAIRYTIHFVLVLWWGFRRGRHFGFAEIQDGGWRTIRKNSNSLISATHYSIHFTYVYTDHI